MRHEVQFAVGYLTLQARSSELIPPRVQDLNGDGRAEYLWVHQNGSVEAWLNLGGPNDGPNAAQVGWRTKDLSQMELEPRDHLSRLL